MKVKLLITKMLLVAAGLCVGASGVWAGSNVGTDNTTAFWSAFSDYYTVEPNRSVTVSFKNYSDKSANWHNWAVCVTTDADRGAEGYSEYVFLRADNYGWANGNSASKNTSSDAGNDNTWFTSLESAYDWDNFKTDMDGADVSLTISRSSSTVTIYADITASSGTKCFEKMDLPCGDGTQNIRFFLTTEAGHLTDVEKSQWEQLVVYDFENESTYKTDWPTANEGAKQEVRWESRTLTGGKQTSHFFWERDYNGGNRETTHTISNSDFLTAAQWKIEFDFGMYGSSSDISYIQLWSGSTALTQFRSAVNWNVTESEIRNSASTKVGSFDCDPYASSTRGTSGDSGAGGPQSITKWYHAIIIGEPSGVFLEVKNESGTTILESTKVADFAIPTSIKMRAGKTFGQCAIDDVKFFKAINPKITTHYELSDGTTLINETISEVISGEPFTPSYPASFQSGTKQYTYVSGGDQIASVTADQAVTIIYSETDMPAGTYYAETYEKIGGTTGWSTSSGTDHAPVIYGSVTNKYLTCENLYHNARTVTGNVLNGIVPEGTDFTMSFDIQLKSQTADNTCDFTIYDYDNAQPMLRLLGSPNSKAWTINNNADQTVTLETETWYTISYSRKGSITYLTITPTAGGVAVFAQNAISTLSSDGGTGNIKFQTGRHYSNFALDNVLVRTWQSGDTPEVTETTYTIKYRDEEGNEIKADVENPTTVGAEVSASSAETAAVYANDKKYIYKSGNDAITAVADGASNVITLVYREAEVWNYTVTNNLGTVLANTTGFEQDEIVQPYPRYELKDGKMYEKGATNNEYRVRFTLTADNQAETITGYTDSNKPGVVYYTEGENITGATVSTYDTKSTRSSNGAVGQNPESSELTIVQNLAPGKYKICATFIKESSGSVTATFKVGNTSYNATNTSGTNMQSADTEEFTITEASDVVWTNNCNLDYVYIQRTGVDIAVTAIGYATLCPTLDLSIDAEGDIEACKAAVSADGKITYTVVNTVKAGEGVLLRSKNGGAATATATVIANATLNADNAFVGIPEKVKLAQSTETGYTNYILSKVDEVLGFYKVNTNGSWCNAGTAYLKVADAVSPVRGFFTLWDDNATGINAVAESKTAEGQAYNLNGQRVSQPAKGLYIVNGKKVIMK